MTNNPKTELESTRAGAGPDPDDHNPDQSSEPEFRCIVICEIRTYVAPFLFSCFAFFVFIFFRGRRPNVRVSSFLQFPIFFAPKKRSAARCAALPPHTSHFP